MSARKWLTTIVVSCTAWLGSGCAEDQSAGLVGVSSEKEAIEILDELDRGKVYGEKASKTEQRRTVWAIRVPRAQLRAARKVLLRSGLPRDTDGGYREMLDKAGMFPNKTDERARLMRAQAEELAMTLEHYDGIIGARVHVIVPEKDRNRGYAQLPTASVMIRYTPGDEKSAGAKRARETDPHPYSIPLPAAAAEIADPTTEKEDNAREKSKSTSRKKRSGTTAEGPPTKVGSPGGEGVRRELEKNWNSDWPVTPSAVCWQIANGVEGLDPWNVTVMYSRAPAYQLNDDELEPPAADPGNTAREKLYKTATALFGITTILLAFLHIRLRRRLG